MSDANISDVVVVLDKRWEEKLPEAVDNLKKCGMEVRDADDDTIRLALIGCGGRGGGAAANALATKSGPVKLVALADVFEERVTHTYDNLKEQFKDAVDVPADRKFIGFDAYKKAMDCLRPG